MFVSIISHFRRHLSTTVLLAVTSLPIHAATFCVTNPSTLQGALATAAINGEPDLIRLVQATYPGNFAYASAEPFALTIEGGYTSNCEARVLQPDNTVLEDASTARVLYLRNSQAGNLEVDGLTIRNGGRRLFEGNGAGLYAETTANIEITNNRFVGNATDTNGGGLWAKGSGIVISGNSFIGNWAGDYGAGASIKGNGATVRLTNSSFLGNSTDGWGGGLYVDRDILDLTVSGNDFDSNSGQRGGGAFVAESSDDVLFEGNRFVRNSVTKHASSFDPTGGGAYFGPRITDLVLLKNEFRENRASNPNGESYGGGASFQADIKTLRLDDNRFRANISGTGGGGANLEGTSDVELTNNTFSDNIVESGDGGGLHFYRVDSTVMTGNTITRNDARDGDGGGLWFTQYYDSREANLYNNIIWGNAAARGADLFIDNDENGNGTPSPVVLIRNDFDRSPAGAQFTIAPAGLEGNLDNIDPDFVNAPAGELHLDADSAVIDGGDPSAPALPDADMDGDPRALGAGPDIGADEHTGRPHAWIESPVFASPGDLLVADGTGSTDADGGIVAYSWTLTGPCTIAGQDNQGTLDVEVFEDAPVAWPSAPCRVRLVVTDDDGLTDDIELEIVVLPAADELAIQEVYIAYYGRPADRTGLHYWGTRLYAEGGNLDALISAYGTSEEYTTRYGELGDSQLINTLYQNMFGRDADPVGLQWYIDERLVPYRRQWTDSHGGDPNGATEYALSRIALDILNGARNQDRTIIDHKREVALYFTGVVMRYGVVYDAPDIPAIVDAMRQVTDDAASVDASEALLDGLITGM